MKNLFIIHGYNGDTLETFGEYVKKESEKLGFEVYMPRFPIKQDATYNGWTEVMNKYLENGLINENTVIVAHSLGTLFTPRYLADKDKKIGLYISIAGFLKDNSGREDIEKVVNEFKPTEEQIDISIKLMNNKYAIYSDNDHLNPIEELAKYAERLNATKKFIKGVGHMGRKSGVKEIPEIIEIIKEIM